MLLTRKHGTFSFLWTVEKTAQGYAHLHLLSSLRVERGELSTLWESVTGGSYVVKADPVSSTKAQNYLAKYCTQQARQRAEPGYEYLKGTRFFSKSRDIQFASFRGQGEQKREIYDEENHEVWEEEGWCRQNVPYWVYLARMREGLAVERVSRVQGVPRAELERKLLTPASGGQP